LALRLPAVSQSLAILKLTGLVSSRRDGQRVLYRIASALAAAEAGWLVIRMPRGECVSTTRASSRTPRWGSLTHTDSTSSSPPRLDGLVLRS
jgi:hypothetical protein